MKIPSGILAPLVVIIFSVVIFSGSSYELPSTQKSFSEATSPTKTVKMDVEGLRCRGTANFFNGKLQGVAGIISVSTFVQDRSAKIEYDPAVTAPEKIKAIIEKPVKLKSGKVVQPFTVTKID